MNRPTHESPPRPSMWAVRDSAVPYLSTLVFMTIIGLWSGEIWPEIAVFKGQAPAVLLPLAGFVVAGVLWLLLRHRRPTSGWALSFLGFFAVLWAASLAGHFGHSDLITHGAWLFVPILAMVGLKPPNAQEGASTLTLLAWTIGGILVAARLLEMFGILTPKFQTAGLIAFDEEYYWLPLNDALGIDGRWPGPFGHNGFTSMMAAFMMVIAVAYWRRAHWILIAIGIFVLIITSGRASAGAAVAGILVLVMFTRKGAIGRIPVGWRIGAGLAVMGAGALLLFSGKSGLTGRQDIWPAFAELWTTAPWWGVGGTGIATSGGITELYGHAHNLYLDTLVRYGALTFAIVAILLVIGAGISLVAASRGYPGPLAILLAYLVTGITEPRNDWVHPGTLILMVIVSVVTAAACPATPPRSPSEESEQPEPANIPSR